MYGQVQGNAVGDTYKNVTNVTLRTLGTEGNAAHDIYKNVTNVTNVTLGTNTTDDTHSVMTARRLRILHSLPFLCILQKLLI